MRDICRRKEDLEDPEKPEKPIQVSLFGFSKDPRSLPEILNVKILRPDKLKAKSVADLRKVEGSRGSISRTNRWAQR